MVNGFLGIARQSMNTCANTGMSELHVNLHPDFKLAFAVSISPFAFAFHFHWRPCIRLEIAS